MLLLVGLHWSMLQLLSISWLGNSVVEGVVVSGILSGLLLEDWRSLLVQDLDHMATFSWRRRILSW